jgi:tyrosine-protein kinase Etk/Wzc
MTDDQHSSELRESSGRSETTLYEVWGIVRRARWLIVGITGATVALAGVLTMVLPPSYEAEASVRIVSQKPGASMLGEVGQLAGLGLAQDEIDTEVGVIQSRRIVHTVAESLALHVPLLEPATPRSEILRVVRAPQDAPPGVFRLTRRGDGTYGFSVESVGNRGTPRSLPKQVRAGVPFRIGTAEFVLTSSEGSAPDRIRFSILPFRKTMKHVEKRLSVERQENGSQIVEIRYSDRDPELAAAVPNAITEAFIAYKESTSNTESRSIASVLRDQVELYGRQLRQAEDRLRVFREQEQVVNPQAQSTEQVKRLARIQAESDGLTIEREALATLVADISRRSGESPSPARQLATVPSFVAYGPVQNILATLTGLESHRSALLASRSEEHPEVVQVTGRIRELEQQLAQLGVNYVANLDKKIASTAATLQGFDSEVAQIPAREAEFGRLFREQELLSQVYVVLQTKLKEAEVKELVNHGDVRVLDVAFVPEEPEYPKPLLNLSLALVMGLLLGLVVATGREVMNTTVRSRADAELATGGLPILGAIPRIGATPGERRSLRRRRTDVSLGDGLVTRRDPSDPVSEAYRTLRFSLASAGAETPKLIVMTSAFPGDGKSTSAANLAVTLAQQGARTLLVDADLRRGRLYEVFGVAGETGLTQVLLGQATLDEVVRGVEAGPTGTGTLHLLAAGTAAPGVANLLGSTRMQQLVAELRDRFDAVVFDAPALNSSADAAILGKVADATLLVVRNGTTQKAALHEAATRLRDLRARLGGVVINDFAEAYALSDAASADRWRMNGHN